MIKLTANIFIVTSLLVSSNVLASELMPPAPKSKICYSAAQYNLRADMRKLWEDHIMYTRNYIISAIADLGDKEAVANRLLSNQDDIGNAIKLYYGEEAGKKLSALLRAHILISADVVAAAKAGNKPTLDKANEKWYANADEVADFLSAANPNWKLADLKDMLHSHLLLTTGEVVSRLKKDWKADIEAYDQTQAHMLLFADKLTDGIALQFPAKFTTD
jgi:hypothetical protein